LVQEYLADIDSADVCEQYLRIERAVLNEGSAELNMIIPALPGATCHRSRWGISPDREIDEALAYYMLLCYGSKMGREPETYRAVGAVPTHDNEPGFTFVVEGGKRALFLTNLKAYLGCTRDVGGR
jgi:hypothetical protein